MEGKVADIEEDIYMLLTRRVYGWMPRAWTGHACKRPPQCDVCRGPFPVARSEPSGADAKAVSQGHCLLMTTDGQRNALETCLACLSSESERSGCC